MSEFWYRARPIDHANPSPELNTLTSAAAAATRAAIQQNAVLYRPDEAFRLGEQEPTPTITGVNLAALDRADLVIAFWCKDTPSFGVPFEVGYALGKGTPVELFTLEGNQGWALQGCGARVHTLKVNHYGLNADKIQQVLNAGPPKHPELPLEALL